MKGGKRNKILGFMLFVVRCLNCLIILKIKEKKNEFKKNSKNCCSADFAIY